jgi:peptidoglycan/LPS O-acetylase OafA/YrhL
MLTNLVIFFLVMTGALFVLRYFRHRWPESLLEVLAWLGLSSILGTLATVLTSGQDIQRGLVLWILAFPVVAIAAVAKWYQRKRHQGG